MKRRKFIELFGISTATAVVAPQVVAAAIKAPMAAPVKTIDIAAGSGIITQGSEARLLQQGINDIFMKEMGGY